MKPLQTCCTLLMCFGALLLTETVAPAQRRGRPGPPQQPQAPPPVEFLGWDYASLGYTLNPGERPALLFRNNQATAWRARVAWDLTTYAGNPLATGHAELDVPPGELGQVPIVLPPALEDGAYFVEYAVGDARSGARRFYFDYRRPLADESSNLTIVSLIENMDAEGWTRMLLGPLARCVNALNDWPADDRAVDAVLVIAEAMQDADPRSVRLKSYVEQGGKLLVFGKPAASLQAMLPVEFDAADPWIQTPQRLQTEAEGPWSDFDNQQVSPRYGVRVRAKTAARVLARWEDGSPAVALGTFGQGQVVYVASGSGQVWQPRASLEGADELALRLLYWLARGERGVAAMLDRAEQTYARAAAERQAICERVLEGLGLEPPPHTVVVSRQNTGRFVPVQHTSPTRERGYAHAPSLARRATEGRLFSSACLTSIVALLLVSPCAGQSDLRFDNYGGAVSLHGTKTGWFHAEEISGRWYFVTPEGHAFFSLGATHAVECIRLDELNLFETRYGKREERLAEFFLGRFQEWGYNSSGYGPLPPMESRIPYVATIWTEGPRSFSAGEKSRYTDIFEPAVQERLRRRVREAAARHVANRYCLGYVFIDLPVWHPQPRRGESYCDFIRSLEPTAPGRTAYDEFVAQRRAGDTAADDEAFLNRIAEVYYTCVVGELRKRDPHHLVLGDRLMALPEWTPDSILVTAAKHVDVISFQPMGTRTMLRDDIDRVFRLTGKPVLLADVNTMTRRPAKDEVDTAEYERSAGEHTLQYYLDAAGSKYCIGLHRCTVRDYQPWNPQYHRRGLLKADDTPYPVLVEYTQRTNEQIYDMVYGFSVTE